VGDLDVERDEAHNLLRATLRPQTPIGVRWFMGSTRPGDFIWPNMVGPMIASERVIDALTAENVSGWSTYPVIVWNRDETIVNGYAGLSITGRCGPIEGHRSIPEPKQFPGGVFTVYRGLYFDSASWDGSDLFLSSDGRLFVFAVQKVKDLFQRVGITGIAFDPLDSVVLRTRPGD